MQTTNTAARRGKRYASAAEALGGAVASGQTLAVGGFGLPDNLMIAGAVEQTGGHPILLPDRDSLPFDSLALFERCVAVAAAAMARRRSRPEGA